jgi:hypothetical protein
MNIDRMLPIEHQSTLPPLDWNINHTLQPGLLRTTPTRISSVSLSVFRSGHLGAATH